MYMFDYSNNSEGRGIKYNNKSAIYFLLDFTVDEGASLSGNSNYKALQEITCMIESINDSELHLFSEVIKDMEKSLSVSSHGYAFNNPVVGKNNRTYKFYDAVWPGHYISVGYSHEGNSPENGYSFIIVNAGEGCLNFKGDSQFVAAIVEYTELPIEKIREIDNFLSQIVTYNEKETPIQEKYFYGYIQDICKGFKRKDIQGPAQVTGSCSFTNIWNIRHFLKIRENNLELKFDAIDDYGYKCIVAKAVYDDIVNNARNGSFYMYDAGCNEIVKTLEILYKIDCTEYYSMFQSGEVFDSFIPRITYEGIPSRIHTQVAVHQKNNDRFASKIEYMHECLTYLQHIKEGTNYSIEDHDLIDYDELDSVTNESRDFFVAAKKIYVYIAEILLAAYVQNDKFLISLLQNKILEHDWAIYIIETFPNDLSCSKILLMFVKIFILERTNLPNIHGNLMRVDPVMYAVQTERCCRGLILDKVDLQMMEIILKYEPLRYKSVKDHPDMQFPAHRRENLLFLYLDRKSKLQDEISRTMHNVKGDLVSKLIGNSDMFFDLDQGRQMLSGDSFYWFHSSMPRIHRGESLDYGIGNCQTVAMNTPYNPDLPKYIDDINRLDAVLKRDNIPEIHKNIIRLVIIYLEICVGKKVFSDRTEMNRCVVVNEILSTIPYHPQNKLSDGIISNIIKIVLFLSDFNVTTDKYTIDAANTIQNISDDDIIQIDRIAMLEYQYKYRKIINGFCIKDKENSPLKKIICHYYKNRTDNIINEEGNIYVNDISDIEKCHDANSLVPLYEPSITSYIPDNMVPIRLECELLDPLHNETLAFLLRTLLLFNSSLLIRLYSNGKNSYYIFLLCYNVGFFVNSGTVIIKHNDIEYLVVGKDEYNQGMPNCFNVTKDEEMYMICFDMMWQNKKPTKYYFSTSVDEKLIAKSNMLRRNVQIIKRRNDDTPYCKISLNNKDQSTIYILSTIFWGNMHVLRNHFLVVHNNFSVNNNYYTGDSLAGIIDGTPYSLLLCKLLSEKEINTDYMKLISNIYLKNKKFVSQDTVFAIEVPHEQVGYKRPKNCFAITDNTLSLSYNKMNPKTRAKKAFTIDLLTFQTNQTMTEKWITKIYETPINFTFKCKINPILQKIDISEEQKTLLSFFMKRQGEARQKNLELAVSFYKYLINPNKKSLCPVHELIMGGGKSQFIMPMTILLLAAHNNIDIRKKNIVVCVPEALLSQTYDIMMDTVSELAGKPLYVIGFSNKFHIGTPSINGQKLYDRLVNSKFEHPNEDIGTINVYDNGIYIMSDTNLKMMHLSSCTDIPNTKLNKLFLKDAYIIFDEIDYTANPLTCELNVQTDAYNSIPNFDELIDLIKLYIDSINNDSELWRIRNIKYEENEYHRIVLNYGNIKDTIVSTISSNLQKVFKEYPNNLNVISYINKYVLEYVLTRKFTYDYGMPDTYPPDIWSAQYKSHAIPYVALDTPAYGSEFSDPILSIFLTFFCYHISGFTRKIDKIILGDYSLLLAKNNNRKYIKFIRELENLTKEEKVITYIREHKHYKIPDFKFSNEDDSIINVKYFLKHIVRDYIIKYKTNMENISMTELLMSVNYTNFISFTGTPFVFLPTGVDGTIGFDKHIEYSNIETLIDGENVSMETSVAICMAINKMRKLYLFSDIFKEIYSILSTGNYNTLIDVGAFFVGLSTIDLIKKISKCLHKKFKYIAYSTDTKKYYDIANDKEMSISSLSKSNEQTFFLFDNSHITGLDFEKYMPANSVGLTTASYNTRLRDVSQGIFRLRGVFKIENQYSDFIVDQQIVDAILESKCELDGFKDTKCINVMKEKLSIDLIDRTETIHTPGQENIVMTIKQDHKSVIAKWYFYNLLCQNEYRYSQSQKKSMLKQNIFGIYRKGGDSPDNLYSIDNFIYPVNEIHIDVDTHNINNIVIKNIKNVNDPNQKIIYKLLEGFNALGYTNTKTCVSFCTGEDIKNEAEQSQTQSIEMKNISNLITVKEEELYYNNNKTISKIKNHTMNDDNVSVLFGTKYISDEKTSENVYFYIFEKEGSLYIWYISPFQAVKIYSSLEVEYNSGVLLSSGGNIIINNAFDVNLHKHKIEKYIREIIGISFSIAEK